MKTVITFTCHDCGKQVETERQPILALRQNPNGAGVLRVKVCSKCQYKIQPGKRGES